MIRAIITACALIAAASYAGEPQTVYRIRIEEGLDERQPAEAYTAEEARAVARLRACLDKLPRGLWLADRDGRLMLVKMGSDGKPVGGK